MMRPMTSAARCDRLGMSYGATQLAKSGAVISVNVNPEAFIVSA